MLVYGIATPWYVFTFSILRSYTSSITPYTHCAIITLFVAIIIDNRRHLLELLLRLDLAGKWGYSIQLLVIINISIFLRNHKMKSLLNKGLVFAVVGLVSLMMIACSKSDDGGSAISTSTTDTMPASKDMTATDTMPASKDMTATDTHESSMKKGEQSDVAMVADHDKDDGHHDKDNKDDKHHDKDDGH